MNIIIPRRDVLLLIGRCCGLAAPRAPKTAAASGGEIAKDAQPPPPRLIESYKPIFTTAAAQLYAGSVVKGLEALCVAWMRSGDPKEREFCEMCGLRDVRQVRAFFSRPVISTMFHTNLGPDDMSAMLPATQDRPSKSLGKVSDWGFCVHISIRVCAVADTRVHPAAVLVHER